MAASSDDDCGGESAASAFSSLESDDEELGGVCDVFCRCAGGGWSDSYLSLTSDRKAAFTSLACIAFSTEARALSARSLDCIDRRSMSMAVSSCSMAARVAILSKSDESKRRN